MNKDRNNSIVNVVNDIHEYLNNPIPEFNDMTTEEREAQSPTRDYIGNMLMVKAHTKEKFNALNKPQLHKKHSP